MCVTSLLLLQVMSDKGESLVSWISRFQLSFPSLVQYHTANTRKLGGYVGMRPHCVCTVKLKMCGVATAAAVAVYQDKLRVAEKERFIVRAYSSHNSVVYSRHSHFHHMLMSSKY